MNHITFKKEHQFSIESIVNIETDISELIRKKNLQVNTNSTIGFLTNLSSKELVEALLIIEADITSYYVNQTEFEMCKTRRRINMLLDSIFRRMVSITRSDDKLICYTHKMNKQEGLYRKTYNFK